MRATPTETTVARVLMVVAALAVQPGVGLALLAAAPAQSPSRPTPPGIRTPAPRNPIDCATIHLERVVHALACLLPFTWVGAWDVKVLIDDRGWTAEFVIPFKTLGFSEARDGDGETEPPLQRVRIVRAVERGLIFKLTNMFDF